MRLSVDTLGTFYEMARQGAGLAADRLTRMADVESRVGATRIEFTTPAEVRAELNRGNRHAGTVVELTGNVDGTTILLFEEESAREVARTLVTDVAEPSDQLVRSAVVEVCGVMNNGFVDGWADVLRTEIELSTPEYVAGDSLGRLVDEADVTESDEAEVSGVANVPDVEMRDRSGVADVTDGDAPSGDGATADDRIALLFRSGIETTGKEIEFEHYFLPTQESAERLFSSDEGVEYQNLAGFDRVAQRGANRVAEDLTSMTGMEMDVDVRRVSFVALDAIPEAVPDERLASVAFSFEGTPSGYLLFLYDEYSARRMVETMVGSAPEEGLGDLGRDAVQEASNIMASGLLDGWANVLDTTIDHTTPAFTRDMGAAVVDPLIVGLSEDQEFAFVFDTRIEAADAEFDLEVFVIPDEADLERALASVDVTRVDEASTNAIEEMDVTDLDEEDLADVREIEGVSLE